MYELQVRVQDDEVVIEAKGSLDDQAWAHLRECVDAAAETGLHARVEPGHLHFRAC